MFCGNVLGSLVVDGTVGLTDPLQAHLGEGVTVPSKDGRTLRLIDLVGQTSGLPRELNRPDSPPEDPFATNTPEVQLAEIQKDHYLFAPGTSAFYSNYGYDLLGTALSTAAGKPYADLLKERVLDPLGMKDTSFNPPADAKDRLMQGHFFDGSPDAERADVGRDRVRRRAAHDRRRHAPLHRMEPRPDRRGSPRSTADHAGRPCLPRRPEHGGRASTTPARWAPWDSAG